MDERDIQIFQTLMETKNVTKTAQALYTTQSAITKRLHKLEEELEIPLFKHDGRNIKLTTYGQWLYKKLTPIVKEIDEIPSLMGFSFFDKI